MCYAYSSPSERDYSLEEIETRLDQLINVEGKGISLQISGGEPSIRKDLEIIAAMVKRKGFATLAVSLYYTKEGYKPIAPKFTLLEVVSSS